MKIAENEDDDFEEHDGFPTELEEAGWPLPKLWASQSSIP